LATTRLRPSAAFRARRIASTPASRTPCPRATAGRSSCCRWRPSRLAFVGWLNETWLFLFESPIWLNRYTEYAIILAFGAWRIVAEKNAYTRRRLIILVGVVTGLWWLVPWLTPFFEPYIGFLWSQPVFPSLHTPGTLTSSSCWHWSSSSAGA
jgi:hypothetical protein